MDKQREAFEQWVKSDAFFQYDDLSLDLEDGAYVEHEAAIMFKAWQAALAQTAGEPEWVKWHECAPTGEGWYLTYWSDGSLETYHIETLDLNKHSINCGPAALTHWAPLPAAPEVDNAEGQQAV